MRKELITSAGAILAIVVMIAPALAQGFCDGPIGYGFGAPFGGFGPGPVGFGFADPFSSIVGLGLSMIDSVIGLTFGVIGSLALGGCGFGLPFGGLGLPFGGWC
jgi:hypothetical protein